MASAIDNIFLSGRCGSLIRPGIFNLQLRDRKAFCDVLFSVEPKPILLALVEAQGICVDHTSKSFRIRAIHQRRIVFKILHFELLFDLKRNASTIIYKMEIACGDDLLLIY